VIFDPATPGGAHARARLVDDRIGWLTTVTASGQPQTAPIWFLWVDDEIIIYSDRRARRNLNLLTNPRVSFHLADDGVGGDIVTVEGEARIDPGYAPIPGNPAYLARYREWIDASLGGPEKMAETYSVPIRIMPTRGLASAG
jgi:PPOX class probable F420-dependent enzyme